MRGRPILLLTAAVLTLLLLSGETDGSRRRRRRRSTTTRPPVDCQWSSWSLSYSNCGNTCGGTKTFTRYRCRPAEHGGADCVGDTQKTEPCAGSSCQNGGQWNGVSCTCSSGFYGSCCHRTLMCPPMDAPANGQISSPDTNGGVTVYFACDPGYTLLGSTSATCQSSGRWSDNRPICQIGTCPALPVLAHGSMYGSLSTGSHMTFSCQPGYTLSGPSSIRCNRHGAWSEQPPICTAVQCPMLSPPVHGTTSSISQPNAGTWNSLQCDTNVVQGPVHPVECGTNAANFHEPTFTVSCPVGCSGCSVCVWGSGIYTDDSSICRAAIHDGRITDAGGQVTVYIRYGQHSYQGSWQHNIQSQPFGAWPRAFAFTQVVREQNDRDQKMATTSCATPGYTMFNGVCYKAYDRQKDYNRARQICAADGGFLAMPRDAASNDHISQLCGADCWIGLSEQRVENRWEWEDGSTLSGTGFNDWARSPAEEKESGGRSGSGSGTNDDNKDCALMKQSGPKWVVHDCTQQQNFVCESRHVIHHQVQTQCTVLTNTDPVAQGSVTGQTYLHGTTIHFTCDPGHTMIGAADRVCQADGQWSGSQPTCQPDRVPECPVPHAPHHGTISGNYFVGDTVTYTCHTGFQLTGSASRYCQSTQHWTGTEPTCTKVQCPVLAAPLNGHMTGGHEFGNHLQFSCNPGYELLGGSTLTCQADGTWDGPEPVCNRIQCPPVQAPLHGQVTQNGDTITYTCDVGYILSGPSTMTCLSTGVWSDQAPHHHIRHDTPHHTAHDTPQHEPQCTAVVCPMPPRPAHGSVAGTTTFGGVITYTCDHGHTLSGSPTQTCQSNQQWSGTPPTCQILHCAALSAPDHGSVSGHNHVGDTVTFTCDPGFYLAGSTDRLCQSDMTWSGTQPTCRRGNCPDLSAPANGLMTGGNRFQNQVQFSCNSGYQLVGSTTLTCQADQTWSGQVPTCVPTQCPTLQVINGFVTGSTVFGSTASCGCDPGFLLIGPATTTCQSTATWSAQTPTCTIKTCQPLVAPNHGSVTGGNNYGDVATYACDPGYEMVGSPTQTCQDNEHWTGSPPYCIRMDCVTLDAPLHGSVSGTSHVGDTVTFSCDPGYEISSGSSSRTCQSSQTWTGTQPTCTKIQCPSVSAPANGNMAGGIEFGDQLQFSCSSGYQLVGSSTLTCQADQTWDGTAPTCSAIHCQPLQPPQNGQVTGGSSFGDTNTYTCDIGYLLFGDSTSYCLSTGTWSSQPPQCTLKTCPPLADPVHGSVVGGNNYGDVAVYACDPGYDLVGTPSQTCQNNQHWSGAAPVCLRMECAILDPPLHGTVSGTNFVGDTVTFACDPGYEITGTSNRTCQSTLDWSGKQPVCTKIQCQLFSVLANGNVIGSNEYGDQLQFQCSAGYHLVGSSTLTCQADQTWSDAAPTCTRIQCSAVQDPLNGHVTGSNVFGSTATYTCDVGYLLSGDSTSTCLSTGSWSSQAPQCTLKTCPPLAALNHGTVTGGNNYGNIATYTCDIGYDLIGNPTQTCQDNQQWTGSPPTCQKVQCTSLSAPTYADMTGTGHEYGDTVHFTCWPGYSLAAGDIDRTCQADGSWSGLQPSCTVNECPKLDAPTNGLAYGQNTLNGVTIFMCNNGYELVGGDAVRQCNPVDMTWSGTQPTCQRKECPQLSAPSNGVVTGGTFYGDQVTFTCDPGYEISGSDIRTCQMNQQWSGTQPTCERIHCPVLSPIADGQMSGSHEFGDQVMFVCNSGYDLSGSSSRVCQADGTWSGIQPSCDRVKCPDVSAPVHGSVTGGVYLGDTVTYSCDSGYELYGTSTQICQAAQTWSATQPRCDRKPCLTLDPPLNGKVNGSNLYGDTVTFTCNVGFELLGDQTRICQDNQQWSGTQPYCQKQQCGQPQAPSNGAVSGGTFYGNHMTFTCDPGYEIFGSAVLTCQGNQQWSASPPTCTLVQCPPLSPVVNGQMSGGMSYGDQVMFTCNPGYILSGTTSRTCQADGTWSGAQPVCNQMKCPDVVAPLHGSLSGGTNIGDTVTYSCDTGYQLVGLSVQTCEATQTWSNTKPTCTRVACQKLDPLTNGIINGTSNLYGDIVTFECNVGYQLVGSSSLTCQSDQQWSGSPPHCQKIQCSPLSPPSMGWLERRNSYGDTVTIVCDTGYIVVGSATLTCQADGQWSAQQPSCQRAQCPSLTIANGQMSGSNFFGDTVTFVCNTGYTLFGSSSRRCLAGSIWSGAQPVCNRTECPDLVAPAAGSVTAGSFYGDTVFYSCITGYEVDGVPVRTCQADQTWSGMEPTCTRKECLTLDPPANGRVVGSNLYGDTVTFVCDYGYELIGDQRRTCQSDQQWSGTQPYCQRKECPPLQVPNNGGMSGTYFVGDQMTFTCNPGYDLNGDAMLTCWGHKQWSGTPPTCDRVSCPALSQPANGQMNGNNLFGDQVTFACDLGYSLNGSISRTCQADGTWSGVQPVCNSLRCQTLASPAHGTVAGGSTFGDTATYSCDTGYEAVGGTPVRMCMASLTWSGTQPSCNKISCVSLSSPVNGGITGSNQYGDTVTYDCSTGFMLMGDQTRTCQSDQQWSGTQPYCQRLQCPQLGTIANGASTGGLYYGDYASFTCNPGYEIQGNSTAVCMDDGQWSSTAPTCIAKECHALRAPADGTMSGTFFVGDRVTFSCKAGYNLVGNNVIVCQDSQSWSGSVPKCESVTCGSLLAPVYGAVRAPGNTFGDTATIMCEPGYELVGDSIRTCEASGLWSGSTPLCQRICCSSPAIQFGDFAGTICYNDTITFNCDPGYEILGATAATCNETGHWDAAIPQCQKVCCSSSLVIPNGQFTTAHGNCFGAVGQADCSEGYIIYGNDILYCNTSGQWEGKMPQCQLMCCGDPGSIRDGGVSWTGLCHGDVATYSCNSGFRLVGNASYTCSASGDWGPSPYCEPYNLCDRSTLPSPSGGTKICFSSPQGSELVDYCQMHCNAPKEYSNHNEALYECSAATGWLWSVRRYVTGGSSLISVNVGVCSSAYFNPFALVVANGLSITYSGAVDLAAIEAEMKNYLLSNNLCTLPCQVGNVELQIDPNARVGPRAKAGRSNTRATMSIQLYGYADESLITQTNTIQMEWVRLAAELREALTVLQQPGGISLSVQGVEVMLQADNMQISPPSLGCQLGEVLEGVQCRRCGPGTYYDIYENDCRPCPYATYQDESGQTECKPCKEGTTTAMMSARNSTDCQAFAECNCGIHPCKLTDTAGYVCDCLNGYEQVDIAGELLCKDIDECTQPGICPNAACYNRPGTYSCQCLPGFEEPNCLDIDECRYVGFCPDNSQCTNTPGSYNCTCLPGYYGDNCEECTPYRGNCYSVSETPGSYDQAKQECHERGGILAVIQDQDMQDFFVQLLSVSNKDAWIGLGDQHFSGEWQWSDGTHITDSSYTYWAWGEPNGSGNCTHLWPAANFGWDDQPCNKTTYHVCQFTF
ncbi:PREDICTED: LOW QUALITY PROTEIN: sushi, von Willebrand factor type A, EGF and pentraxin domain-containing protein 1-like [Branchiostoma belcheri]|uniref:LOW QUALITY PROTEIN: sushi, von Willebrand factor type A, EGF and pentraxin domain-containing protein 1-like n=1 Tax=Branchiostoma belcheri TaxID=7741 RepID=A0A6P5ADW5_BRABE|nr:PREDICTED: LOW QUALITY PROTEIN: sushi, von Willebrand factor type A, EGF and pentraxin domain-containing protein 1-like [Branchiostoma belcheri]